MKGLIPEFFKMAKKNLKKKLGEGNSLLMVPEQTREQYNHGHKIPTSSIVDVSYSMLEINRQESDIYLDKILLILVVIFLFSRLKYCAVLLPHLRKGGTAKIHVTTRIIQK